MLMPRSAEEFAAVTNGTSVPLAAMTIGAGRPTAEMRAAGYALSVDPMSATVLGFRALKAGYEGILSGAGFGMSREEVLQVIHEVGETIGIQALYDIEAKTTERAQYDEG